MGAKENRKAKRGAVKDDPNVQDVIACLRQTAKMFDDGSLNPHAVLVPKEDLPEELQGMDHPGWSNQGHVW
jgi:hypothetical protein